MTSLVTASSTSAAAVVFASAFISCAAVGQIHTQAPETGIRDRYNMSILNDTDQTIRFTLRPKAAAWTEYKLSPAEKGIYSCAACGGNFEVKLSTDGKVLTYDISSAYPYAIRINTAKNIYDIYRIN
jgi:hypothetical protein